MQALDGKCKITDLLNIIFQACLAKDLFKLKLTAEAYSTSILARVWL